MIAIFPNSIPSSIIAGDKGQKAVQPPQCGQAIHPQGENVLRHCGYHSEDHLWRPREKNGLLPGETDLPCQDRGIMAMVAYPAINPGIFHVRLIGGDLSGENEKPLPGRQREPALIGKKRALSGSAIMNEVMVPHGGPELMAGATGLKSALFDHHLAHRTVLFR